MRAHVGRLQRIVSCISQGHVVQARVGSAPAVYAVAFGRPGTVALSGSSGRYSTTVRQRLGPPIASALGRHRVDVLAYSYVLRDFEGPEILAYHWHPEVGRSTEPHLHISAGAGQLRSEFYRAHLPTGEVSVRQFVRLLIEAFGVRPLRTDWETLLAPPSGDD